MKRGIGLVIVAVTFTGAAHLLWAQEAGKNQGANITQKTERTADPRAERAKRPDMRQLRQPGGGMPGMPPQMARGGAQQQLRVMQEQIAGKRREFDVYAAELKAIREMALKEKAKKTAEYIDKLLERKEKELAAEIKTSEDRMKQMQEQMKKMMEERTKRIERQRDPAAAMPERAQPRTQKEKPETKTK